MPVLMNMVEIHIHDRPYRVRAGQSLLRACLSLGFEVPYFCWHPAMESVGACRQCAVKQFRDEKDARGRIIMSCMVEVEKGMRISVDDPEAAAFRAGNIEWLMLNHPHDCPVCDEGGECHLQDMTVLAGHTYRRTRFKKRTYRNQDLGPFLNHEMNRCIHCYRCVRFYRDYAGGRDLGIFSAHDHVYFGRHESGPLENVFSGNLAEICPTGVFTDKTERKTFIRNWDLRTAPSVCVHCGLGCNTLPGERYGRLQRIRNRFNGRVNGYFLCDRGRFGYDFVNSPARIRRPLIRTGRAGHAETDTGKALTCVREMLSAAKGIAGIGSPRASLEANYALRALVGREKFSAGMSEGEFRLVKTAAAILQAGPVRTPSLMEMQTCDAVFILGEDITNTAPVMALSVLQALRNIPVEFAAKLNIPIWNDRAIREEAQHRNGPLFITTAEDTWLDREAESVLRAAPDDSARLGFAVAHNIDPASPDVAGLSEAAAQLSIDIAGALKQARKPLIISGTTCGSGPVLEAAANVAQALCRNNPSTRLAFVVPECNSLGLGLMSDNGIDGALDAVEKDEADTLIILENDLFRRGDPERIRGCREKCRQVVLLDHLFHETAALSHLVLPAATFVEQTGTLVNSEGRGQRFFQVFLPEGEVRPSREWIGEFREGQTRRNLDSVIASIAQEFPVFNLIPRIAPDAGFRMVGRKIPRQPNRAGGRTCMYALENIFEPSTPDDPDTCLSFSMEGYEGRPPAPLIPRFWAPGWNSVQAVNKFQAEVGGELQGGDPGLRLIEPDGSAGVRYFQQVPAPYQPKTGFLLVPLYRIFGSEELSALSSPIASRISKPAVALNPLDAEGLRLREGEEAEVVCSGRTCRFPVVFRPLAPGTAGLPAGFPETAGMAWNRQAEIRKAAT